jgi:ABC-type multidrug transport system ATPase subunit
VSQHYPPGSTDQHLNAFTLSVNNLSKRFNREWIFRDLNFDFTAGKTYAITGPNGSGKSSLLQVLWGQVPQTSGSINYRKENKEVPIQEVSAHVSIATPYMDLIDEFTLLEQLNFHFKLKSIRPGISIPDFLRILYLEEAATKTIGNFSSGMKQRVKLGLAFYTQAELLFLDEPGTNLDARAFEWYRTELKKVPPHSLIFIASNNPLEYPESALILNLLDFKK